jgi:hypothetical protein
MFVFVIFLIGMIKAEGYFCPYTDLGATSANQLLYDYYNGNSFQGYWTRTGETGWQSVSEYCRLKGDTSVHADAGEWKCNDSRLTCIWNGSSCNVNPNRLPDCRELCQAVLNNEGPQCLGNCPGGQSGGESLYGNPIYDKYCPPTTSMSSPTATTSMSSPTATTSSFSILPILTSAIIVTVTVTETVFETEAPRFSRKGRSCGNDRKIIVD